MDIIGYQFSKDVQQFKKIYTKLFNSLKKMICNIHENIYTFLNHIINAILTDLTGEEVSFSQATPRMQSCAN